MISVTDWLAIAWSRATHGKAMLRIDACKGKAWIATKLIVSHVQTVTVPIDLAVGIATHLLRVGV